MKNVMQIGFIAFLSFFGNVAFSQDKWDFEWEQYHIAFTLAEDFKVKTNNGDEFIAKGDGMEFGIFPFSDASVDHSSITNYVVDIAKSIKLENVDDADLLELNGLKGAYVEGYKNGSRVVLLGFIDPESDTNFYCIITFSDDDKEAEDEAVRMIKSFRKKS
jgi:hypothetical protein